ncbi:hypothetical protein [uncultured Arthrobacter sp.]|uniref:hypothetical protein n=1 Tax=uncultured Arthrobacter sp. TaxID=114050 RepID=UPI003217E930
MSRFRSFIRHHLVADDPAPGYSRLDRFDGLGASSAGQSAPGGEAEAIPSSQAASRDAALAAIEERLTADENEFAGGVADQSARDRRYLLALVQERRSQIERVEDLASYLDRLGPHDRHYSRLIRTALIPADENRPEGGETAHQA